MTETEFEKTIESVANVMSAYHLRLLRVEEWMLKQEEMREHEEEREATS